MGVSDLSRNLRLLCDYEKSVSEVCRAVGLNRQQFSKYLNGTSQPSPFNLKRICDHFGIRSAELLLPHDEFADRMQFNLNPGTRRSNETRDWPLAGAFTADKQSLRRYLGYYFIYYYSFSWDDRVVKGMTHIYEDNGIVCCKTLERHRDPSENVIYRSKYEGQVAFLRNRVFIVEYETLANDAIVQTMLYPAARSELTLLRGVTFGLSTKNRNPCVSRCAFRYLGTNVDLRTAMKSTGIFPINSNQIDSRVARIIGETPFPNERLRFDPDVHVTT